MNDFSRAAVAYLPALKVVLDVLMDFEEHAQTQPEKGQDLLAAMFQGVSKKVMVSQPSRNELIATIFLGEYFKHRGDWSAMCRCVAETIASATDQPVDAVLKDLEHLRSPGDSMFAVAVQ